MPIFVVSVLMFFLWKEEVGVRSGGVQRGYERLTAELCRLSNRICRDMKSSLKHAFANSERNAVQGLDTLVCAGPSKRLLQDRVTLVDGVTEAVGSGRRGDHLVGGCSRVFRRVLALPRAFITASVVSGRHITLGRVVGHERGVSRGSRLIVYVDHARKDTNGSVNFKLTSGLQVGCCSIRVFSRMLEHLRTRGNTIGSTRCFTSFGGCRGGRGFSPGN